MTRLDREEMFARFEAIDIWLTYVYDTERTEHTEAHAFAQSILKTADPRVRAMMKRTLAWDRQAVMFMTLFQRN